ncbi:glycosyltransferase [Synechococcus sp. CBW1004]|uniref:glycosyltransferase n=1 Tax=Synechococcus sp. CBW1004 TaxID=1353136 RepID=UPI0018CF2E1B|nr:glycosyltransferase [Synechococcus sp. CBW1004]QPN62406.1 glycosyltransferase family 4 protein [Synechococcus sp. CBW1004]
MRVLMLDGALPARESSAGERATFDLIDALHNLGHKVSFSALGINGKETERLPDLVASGVELLPGHGGGLAHLHEVLREPWDAVIVQRPGPALLAAETLTTTGAISLHWGHDIHTWRLEAQQRLCGSVPGHKLKVTALSERRCWQFYDLSVYPTRREADYINSVGGRGAAVPYYRLNSEDLITPDMHTSRRGCLMVGASFHAPNRDALGFAVADILPLLGREARITVVGEWPLEHRAGLDGKGVRFAGRVSEEELRRLHGEHLCLLAPLRFGAGTRRKLVAAMGLGLPVVTSAEGLRGLLVRDGFEEDGVLIAASAKQFADRVVELTTSHSLWEACSIRAQAAVAAVYSAPSFDNAVAEALKRAGELHNGH